ncbi:MULTISPECIES: hypothetical protein [unclassified Streptomyces]|uniref:hypothetical protein n=1 Tax=unclassified Streptomyces TaxID=2593676 RepID=UPI0036558F88
MMFDRRAAVLAAVLSGCLVLPACSAPPAVVTADPSRVGTPAAGTAPATSSAESTGPAPSPAVELPTPDAVGGVPDAARLAQLVLQRGEAVGVPGPDEVREAHPSELRPLTPEERANPCTTMWALLRQHGARAAVTQTFTADAPGEPVHFLASYAGTDAQTTFAQLRTALAACPRQNDEGREATVRYEDLDGAEFPEDTVRIRMTFRDEGSQAPSEVMERIVTRVGVCISDLVGMGPEPHPPVSEQAVLRQIQRLRAAQGL